MRAEAELKTRKKQGGSGGGGGAAGSGGGGDGFIPASLADEARRRYINYALSVITSRALPDVRDGLKPVQRRILYGMWNDLNLSFDTKYQKCAQVVGAIMGRYHPHGDASIYDALVRMAQDFSLRYPLVDGHGNFGSLDGDSAAAYRYTECRLDKLATEMLGELERKTVDFRPTYDGTRNEPIVIPARVPQLLMNGTTGIAVGMATNIPPHHLGELVDALVALIETPALLTKDLLKWVKGPDFPTGGQILNDKKELREIYETGQGSVRIRGEWDTEELKRGGTQIIITSIPYTVNKSTLVSKIGDLVRERKLPLIVDVRDESTKDVRIVLELKKDANAELVMAYLYKHTPLQTTFGVNLTCLVPSEDNPEVGTPRRLNLKDILQHFLDFRFGVITRRFQHELGELQKRVHLLEGFEKAYDALDEIIRIIRQSEGKQDAAQKLMKRFQLDELQVDAILEMKLYKLARLEILVVQKELKEKRAEIKRIEGILKDKKKVWATVKDELGEIKGLYNDKRRTKIGGAGSEEVEFNADAFIADEDAHVVLTRDGWVKRVREVKDPSSTRLREGDAVMTVLAGSLKANLVLFSNFGTAYVTRFNDIPASTGYGDPVQKLFKFDDGERVVAAWSLDARLDAPAKLVGVTKQGMGMRFLLEPHLEVSTRAGRRYAKTGEGDEIIGVREAGEKDLLAVLTKKTNALVCKVAEVNELAGPGKGVTVIKVDDDDQVVEFLVSAPNQKDAKIDFDTQKGRKLQLAPAKYGVTGRGGKGHEMSKRDAVEDVARPVVFIPLPEKKD
ncbi:DNA gyrase subunit A [Myxococcus fulvus]|uniref:DNA topoisomerase (ATP-hydrolyzing) n=1 Tax=Myxococcus fulvus TaxID=33 RepID=A0ABY1CPJ0_MYXFU|nr:DNA topoisomerase IV subunit A [Myxococcus fulvus]SEU29395.1 DNA gyrase subunit A [Myxococcus fulvus]